MVRGSRPSLAQSREGPNCNDPMKKDRQGLTANGKTRTIAPFERCFRQGESLRETPRLGFKKRSFRKRNFISPRAN
jgi:hypothetical protein